MEILVRGRNVELDPEVIAAGRRKLSRLERLAPDIRRIEVQFSEIKNPRVSDREQCEVIVHLKGTFVKAHATAPDLRTALDRAAEKTEHQVARLHEKRIGRSHPRRVAEPIE